MKQEPTVKALLEILLVYFKFLYGHHYLWMNQVIKIVYSLIS